MKAEVDAALPGEKDEDVLAQHGTTMQGDLEGIHVLAQYEK